MDKRKLKGLLVGDFTLKRLITSVFSIVILVYLGMFLYSYLYAEKIIFQPQPSSYRDTNQIIKLNSEGVQISAIYLNDPKATYTILYSHGNAEDIGLLRPMLEDMKVMGYSVLAYDYRGYGTSSGTPSEENAYRDVDAAYNYLVNNLGVPASRIIALGRSLGGAVTVDLAHRRQVGGLIVESSFITAYRVLTWVPLFPFDKFQSISKIKEIHCPVLVVHGKRDEVIPLWHGERLLQEANEPKQSFWVDGAGHNDLFEIAGSRYSEALRNFVVVIERSDRLGR